MIKISETAAEWSSLRGQCCANCCIPRSWTKLMLDLTGFQQLRVKLAIYSFILTTGQCHWGYLSVFGTTYVNFYHLQIPFLGERWQHSMWHSRFQATSWKLQMVYCKHIHLQFYQDYIWHTSFACYSTVSHSLRFKRNTSCLACIILHGPF